MEAKLKGLKVPELKALLQQANVSFDSKLTKLALIKKILESPAAVAVASAPDDSAGADDDLPDLPPSINWDDAPKATTAATSSVQKAPTASAPQIKAPLPTPATGATNTAQPHQPQSTTSPSNDGEGSSFKAANVPTLSVEDEIAKRQARAAKWGTPFVDPLAQAAAKPAPKKKAATSAAATSLPEDEEKQKQREARFGISSSKATASVVDDEETRKRKAREERFGANKKPRLEGEGQQ